MFTFSSFLEKRWHTVGPIQQMLTQVHGLQEKNCTYSIVAHSTTVFAIVNHRVSPWVTSTTFLSGIELTHEPRDTVRYHAVRNGNISTNKRDFLIGESTHTLDVRRMQCAQARLVFGFLGSSNLCGKCAISNITEHDALWKSTSSAPIITFILGSSFYYALSY